MAEAQRRGLWRRPPAHDEDVPAPPAGSEELVVGAVQLRSVLQWQLRLLAIDPTEAVDGTAAIFTYTTHLPGREFHEQVYFVLCCCMREFGDPDWRRRLPDSDVARHVRVIRAFRQLNTQLARILTLVRSEESTRNTFRGIKDR
eukprot:gene385-678_t